jgi:NADH:ubiquinone oxidoreductase subunit 2 (subunit N)
MQEPETTQVLTVNRGLKAALVFSLIVVLALGIYPEPLANYAQSAILSF